MRGNIRNVDHFIAFLYRFVEYIKKRLRTQNEESPARFLQDIRKEVGIDQKTLRFLLFSTQSTTLYLIYDV